MTAGNPATKTDLDRMMGNAIVGLAQALDLVSGINDMLLNDQRAFTVTISDSAFVSAELSAMGYSDDEITLIAEAFSALAGLRQIALGLTAQPGASATNFFFQAQQLMGVTPL